MSLVTLKTELRQELKLTPQLLQSMEVLQMTSQELLDYLNRASEENPLLEQEDSPALRSAYEELRHKVSWLDAGNTGHTFTHAESSLPERGAVDRETESLSAFLCDQLERRQLPKPLLSLSKYMAELLDEDGFLTQEDLDELVELKIPPTMIEEALAVLQSLEPAGVGARSLSECLLLQLKRQGDVSPALQELVSSFLTELSRKHYGPITKKLGMSLEEIHAAEKRIAALNPRPGQAFQPEEPVVYVRPDIYIVELDGELKAILNEYYLPRISVSHYYVQLLQAEQEKETREYLQQKLRQAKWLLNSLERRDTTLRRCAEAILAAQRDFFAGKTTSLIPMNLASLSEELSLHPSTISRATRGKYLQCRQGTYPLRYFFSRSVGAMGCSAQSVRQKILQLIRDEDPHRPLSDQQLCDRLGSAGFPVARRTVAKYRMELGIAASSIRKR